MHWYHGWELVVICITVIAVAYNLSNHRFK